MYLCPLFKTSMSEYVPNEARQKYVLRNLRRESFQDYDAIIFVVDSADKDSFDEARRELWNFLRLLKEIEMPVKYLRIVVLFLFM